MNNYVSYRRTLFIVSPFKAWIEVWNVLTDQSKRNFVLRRLRFNAWYVFSSRPFPSLRSCQHSRSYYHRRIVKHQSSVTHFSLTMNGVSIFTLDQAKYSSLGLLGYVVPFDSYTCEFVMEQSPAPHVSSAKRFQTSCYDAKNANA